MSNGLEEQFVFFQRKEGIDIDFEIHDLNAASFFFFFFPLPKSFLFKDLYHCYFKHQQYFEFFGLSVVSGFAH